MIRKIIAQGMRRNTGLLTNLRRNYMPLIALSRNINKKPLFAYTKIKQPLNLNVIKDDN